MSRTEDIIAKEEMLCNSKNYLRLLSASEEM